MRAVMARLGNVQDSVPMVHVAGTNGKGSCCAMMERVLREAGAAEVLCLTFSRVR